MAASQIPWSSVSLETTPVVPGGQGRPVLAFGRTAIRRTVLGPTQISVWREECAYVGGQQASCLVEVGSGGVYREVLLLDEVDAEDGLVPGKEHTSAGGFVVLGSS